MQKYDTIFNQFYAIDPESWIKNNTNPITPLKVSKVTDFGIIESPYAPSHLPTYILSQTYNFGVVGENNDYIFWGHKIKGERENTRFFSGVVIPVYGSSSRTIWFNFKTVKETSKIKIVDGSGRLKLRDMNKWHNQKHIGVEIVRCKSAAQKCGVEIAAQASMDSQNHIYCNWRHFYVVLC